MNHVVGAKCPAQTPSWIVITKFWVGLIHACTIWSHSVPLRIGRASPLAISHCPFKFILLESNIAHVTLNESSCLPPSSIELDLYWHCYNLCARDRVLWHPKSRHTVQIDTQLDRKVETSLLQVLKQHNATLLTHAHHIVKHAHIHNDINCIIVYLFFLFFSFLSCHDKEGVVDYLVLEMWEILCVVSVHQCPGRFWA